MFESGGLCCDCYFKMPAFNEVPCLWAQSVFNFTSDGSKGCLVCLRRRYCVPVLVSLSVCLCVCLYVYMCVMHMFIKRFLNH